MDEKGTRDPLDLELSRDWILALRASERRRAGDLIGALEDLNEVIKLGRIAGGESHESRGILRYALGDLEGAVADLTMAIQLGRRSERLYDTRGRARYRLRDYADAAADFTVVIWYRSPKHDPLHACDGLWYSLSLCKAYAYRAYSRFKAGDPDGADKDYLAARWNNFVYKMPLPPDRPDIGWIPRESDRVIVHATLKTRFADEA